MGRKKGQKLPEGAETKKGGTHTSDDILARLSSTVGRHFTRCLHGNSVQSARTRGCLAGVVHSFDVAAFTLAART